VCCRLQVAPSGETTEVTAGLEESNGSLLLGLWHDSLHVTGGLTACKPGSAPGPTLGNEYGKTLPFYLCLAENDFIFTKLLLITGTKKLHSPIHISTCLKVIQSVHNHM